jgi:hypothetical protein
MVDGLVPYDFFCEDSPAINLFVFTGAATPDATVEEQTPGLHPAGAVRGDDRCTGE